MKRLFDIFLSVFIGIVFSIPMLLIALLVKCTSRGPVFYWSDRVGKNNKIFKMPKFRTMKVETPEVATHLLTSPQKYLTSIGGILRKTSLDELPQFICILKGDMSFVGPRPALFNQDDLIALRVQYGVHKLVPGLTGLAQISGRDELPIAEKVKMDSGYMEKQSLLFDCYIIIKTFINVIKQEGVVH